MAAGPFPAPGWHVTAPMAGARIDHAATALENGKVLVSGGGNGSSTGYYGNATLYDVTRNEWMSVPSMASARAGHSATRLLDGRVLVAGGRETDGTNVTAIETAEIYDPAINRWSTADTMAFPRWGHAATVLPSGKVLVSGGTTESGQVRRSAELYDPATDQWSPAGSMTVARTSFTATALTDGRVVAVGSLDGSAMATAEVYDPTTDTWIPTADMAIARHGHVAGRLPD